MSDQEIRRSTRKSSLKTLQRTATDVENLVGRPQKNKHQHSPDALAEVEVKRKTLSTKETQANLTNKITVEDLTNPDGPSESYWKTLAERTQVILEQTLEDNAKLEKKIEDLKAELETHKQMLEEANNFVEVIREQIFNNEDDTGIDVNDVSTADETIGEGTIGDATSGSSEESEEDKN